MEYEEFIKGIKESLDKLEQQTNKLSEIPNECFIKKSEEVIKTEKPHSFEFRYGGTGSQVKLYFEDSDDLSQQLLALTEKGSKIKEYLNAIKEKLKE